MFSAGWVILMGAIAASCVGGSCRLSPIYLWASNGYGWWPCTLRTDSWREAPYLASMTANFGCRKT